MNSVRFMWIMGTLCGINDNRRKPDKVRPHKQSTLRTKTLEALRFKAEKQWLPIHRPSLHQIGSYK